MSDNVSLNKGATINLSKVAADAGTTLNKLIAAAGWDGKAGKSIDLDLMVVYLGEDGKGIPDANGNGTNLDEAVCFYKNLSLPGAMHSGDNLDGAGEGDDETITLDLANVPAHVKEIAVIITSFSGETFGEVENAFIRMVNAAGEQELAKFELKDGMGSTKAVEAGRIERKGSEWEFKATGVNIDGDPAVVLTSYGVTGL